MKANEAQMGYLTCNHPIVGSGRGGCFKWRISWEITARGEGMWRASDLRAVGEPTPQSTPVNPKTNI